MIKKALKKLWLPILLVAAAGMVGCDYYGYGAYGSPYGYGYAYPYYGPGYYGGYWGGGWGGHVWGGHVYGGHAFRGGGGGFRGGRR